MAIPIRGFRFNVNGVYPSVSTDILKYPPDSFFTAITPIVRTTQLVPLVPTIILDYEGTTAATPAGYVRIMTRLPGRHHYFKTNLFNCDNSRLLTSGGLFCDGDGLTTGVVYKQISTVTAFGTNFDWDKTDKDKLYTITNLKLYVVKPSINLKTIEHDFADHSTTLNPGGWWTEISKGAGGGNMDDDCDLVPIGGTRISPTGPEKVLGYFRRSTKQTIVKPFSFFGIPDATSGTPGQPGYIESDWESTMFHNGQGLIVNNAGTILKSTDYQFASYDLNLNLLNPLGLGSHGDVATDTLGNTISVRAAGVGYPIGYSDVITAARGNQLPSAYNRLYNNNQAMAGHASGRNTERPGWYYFSNSGYIPSSGSPGYREIFAVKADGAVEGAVTINRFGFVPIDRPSLYLVAHPGQDYDFEPSAVPNRDGTKVTAKTCYPGTNDINSYVYEMIPIAEYNARLAAVSLG